MTIELLILLVVALLVAYAIVRMVIGVARLVLVLIAWAAIAVIIYAVWLYVFSGRV